MSNLPKGGSYLFGVTNPEDIFTPEDFTDEHKMIYSTTTKFVTNDILPVMEEIEEKKEGLARQLLKACSELGLLGIDIPEKYEGLEMDKITSALVSESMGRAGTFGMMIHGGVTGIGSTPIVFFGNDDQKMRYLPGVAAADKVGAYALTEPEAGTDAMAIKSRAVLSEDGKYYTLNGTKQFITNVGIADYSIVFANVDGEKFTAFIIDEGTEGLSSGLEEKKMGIKGSSTRTIIMENVKVPVENVLFKVGLGHVVAFNILNLGRFKLAASAIGQAKFAMELSATYANERHQFKVPIASFGLIKEKLAEMATGIYVAESTLYRAGGLLDGSLHGADTSDGQVVAKNIEEYALECSMNKVFATEMLAYCVDEGVQIHGGYGYSSEYAIERLYRDARISRIFEGTNEINRSIIPTTLLRKADQLPLQETFEKLHQRIANKDVDLNSEAGLVQAAKDIFLFVLDAGMKKLGKGLMRNQEVIGKLADLAIQAYAMESAWLRAQKAAAKSGDDAAKTKINMATLYINANFNKLANIATEALADIVDPGDLVSTLEQLQVISKFTPKNTIGIRREIAATISAAGKYVC